VTSTIVEFKLIFFFKKTKQFYLNGKSSCENMKLFDNMKLFTITINNNNNKDLIIDLI